MRLPRILYFASLLAASYANVQPTPSTSDPTITPAPAVPIELLRKQNGNRFMGWIEYDGEWTTRQCDIGGTLYQSGDYWRCCATTIASCNVPVGCISGSLIYSFSTGTVDRGTYACTEIYTDATDSSFTLCNTGFMFENTLDSSPQTNIFCGVSAVNWSYYRVKPEVTSSEPESSTTPSSSPRSTSANPTAVSATASPTAASQPKEESKAWIAGAVVGPIAGLALIGAGLFFCLRRRSNKKTPPAAPAAASSGPPSSYPGSPNTTYQQPYYPPMQQNNNSGFVPYGVGVGANEQKHQSFYAPVPQSPHSHGSTSPHPPNSPYVAPGQPQQWQPIQQPTSPQMLGSDLNHPQQGYQGTTPPMSPQTQHGDVVYNGDANKQAHPQVYEHRVVSSELDSTPYQPPVMPHGQEPR